MNLSDDQLTELVATNDVEVTDVFGREYTLRLHVEPDNETSINDYDCYGTISQGYDYWHEAKSERPAGFDGAARKMQIERGTWVWWQPPADIKPESESVADLFRLVRNLIECGFTAVGVSLHETVTDSLGHDHEVQVDVAWLGGIDTTDDPAYLRSVVADLLLELPDLAI